MESLDLKNSSRNLQVNCVISFCFHLLYLMFYVYVVRFDVTENFEKFLVFGMN